MLLESNAFSMDKEEIANEVETKLKELIPSLTGRNYRYKLKGKQKEKLFDVLSLQEKHYNLDYKNMSLEEQRKNLTELSNSLSEKVFGVKKNPFEILEKHLMKYFDHPGKGDFMHNTKFKRYKEIIFQIVDKVYRDKHSQQVDEYAKKLSIDEAMGIFQRIREINTEDHNYLNKNRNRITRQVLDRYISIYDSLSGVFEKYIQLLVWIKILFDGGVPDFEKIKGDSLSNHVGLLKGDPLFKDLVAPFDTIIRNAIAHEPQFVFLPLQKKIRFLDKKDSRKSIDVGYSDFITKTKELGANVYILSMIGVAFNLQFVRQMKQHFRGLINSENIPTSSNG
jgi:hypothetical protein